MLKEFRDHGIKLVVAKEGKINWLVALIGEEFKSVKSYSFRELPEFNNEEGVQIKMDIEIEDTKLLQKFSDYYTLMSIHKEIKFYFGEGNDDLLPLREQNGELTYMGFLKAKMNFRIPNEHYREYAACFDNIGQTNVYREYSRYR